MQRLRITRSMSLARLMAGKHVAALAVLMVALGGVAVPAASARHDSRDESATLPTSKDQCKDGGWRSFGTFKNQGDCVSFVASGGKNLPVQGVQTQVTLIHAGGETCFGPTLPGAPTQSTATITANNTTVSATVNLVNAQRSTTYNVMLSTCRNGILQKTGFQFVPTNASGNGTTPTPITVPRGNSTGAIITALPLDGSGQLLAAPNVVMF